MALVAGPLEQIPGSRTVSGDERKKDMDMKRLLMLVPIASLLIGPAVAAPMAGMSGTGTLAQGTHDPYKQIRKRHALAAIRDEALKQQAADGGKLTEAHRAEFQRRLDAVRAGNY
jgi:hypothetical protein